MAGKRSISNTRTHKLTKSAAKSYALIIPIEFIRHLGWKEKQNIDIILDGKKLIVRDWKK